MRFDPTDYYDQPSWKPEVKQYPGQSLWYVSRRRKKKPAEYLTDVGEWRLWAHYFANEAEAVAAKDLAYRKWEEQYQQSKAKFSRPKEAE